MNNSDEVFGKNLTVYGSSMTNDKQQVEAWAEEFDKKYFHMSTVKLDKNTGKYRVRESSIGNEIAERECILMNNWLDIWIAAKRSLPTIELPSGHGMTISYREGISDAKDAIAAAGYSYRVKE